MHSGMTTRQRVIAVVILGALAALSAVFLTKNVDFQVYWRGVGGFLNGSKPLYGSSSGAGHPQEFRYPPVTVLLFLPVTWLPERVAGMLWVMAGWAACAWASALAIVKWRLRFTLMGAALGILILGQFVVLFVKFGNVQPFLIALVLVALLWSDEHPAWSGAVLAVAICFKVWPLFFAPWFLVRGRRPVVGYAAAGSAVLWTAPILFFGWSRYVFLLRDFFDHVVALASNPEALWYSSQSLRGVLLRFLTHAAPPRDGYPDVSFASLSPALVGNFCLALTAVLYGYAVFSMWRTPSSRRWLWDANAFVFFSILQPFAMNSGLISLLPAVLAAAHVYSAPAGQYPASARRCFLATCACAAVATSTFYRPLQREALMLGIDFWMMVALAATLVIAASRGESHRRYTGSRSDTITICMSRASRTMRCARSRPTSGMWRRSRGRARNTCVIWFRRANSTREAAGS